ncbi:DUF2155 domain-containing protein [Phenylobacterium sp.]|uniref:DUF2155 domain-containing protein n=1 Tax=Phenylobacterium sp. TaxID=1871053 RepID=UPI0025DF7040|nr:DUF2155 domain-containing protein [Phenylobacterium sp.]
MGRRIPPHLLRRAGLGLGLGVLLTTVVAAQPAPPTAPVPAEAPTAPTPKAAAEEAPPAAVTAPAPTAPPDTKDVAPARPPKALVTEKPVETITPRARYDIAVLQALDKVTAETLRFEARVGAPVRWKGLVFTVRACERTAPDEPIDDSVAYLTIDSQPRAQPGRATLPPKQAFKGWMYASSPGLNPVQHATYDAWVISCRASAPLTPVAAVAPRPPAARPPPAEPKLLDLPPAKAAAPPAPEPKAAPAPSPSPAVTAPPAPKTP